MNRMIEAVRQLRRERGLAITAAATLAVGIMAGTLMFAVISTVLWRPLPYRDPGRLVMVWGHLPHLSLGFEAYPVHGIHVADIQANVRALESVDGFKADLFNVAGPGGEVERIDGIRTTAGLFATMGVDAAAGRVFARGEDTPGRDRVAVVGYGLWMRMFGGSPALVGQTIRINNEPYEVIGVAPRGFDFPRGGEMPANFQFPARAELWVPAALPKAGPSDLAMIARLRPGVTLAQAQAALDANMARLEALTPAAKGWLGVRAVPLEIQTLPPATRTTVELLFIAAMALVLVACGNAAQLLVARGLRRRVDYAVRSALGASRARLVGGAIIESAIVSGAAAALGLGAAAAGVDLVRAIGPSRFPRLSELTVDWRLGVFAVACGVLTALATSAWPAVALTRPAPASLLRSAGRGAVGGPRRLRHAVLAAQVGLSMVLLVASALLMRSLVERLRVDTGFEPARVVTFELTLPPATYPEQLRGPVPAIRPKIVNAVDAVLARLRALPEVASAAAGKPLPMSGAQEATVYTVEGVALPPGESRPVAEYIVASSDLFRTLGARLVSGREFSDADRGGSLPVVVVNRAFAEGTWPGRDPIGKRVRLGSLRSPSPWMTVVGVVDNMKRYGLDEQPLPAMIVPYTQGAYPTLATMPFAVRSTGDNPVALIPAIRAAVAGVDPLVPVASVATMTGLVARVSEEARFAVILLAMFAATALLLTMVGLSGAVAFAVVQRRPEIGVRLALGAAPSRLAARLCADGLRPALAGIAGGTTAAWAVSRLLRSLLFGVAPHDALTYAAVPVVVLIVSLIACAIPASRAARVDPRETLR